MKRTIVFFFAALVALQAAAADKTTDTPKKERKGYLPSSFQENWFVQGGGGVNTVFNSGFGRVAPAAELSFGKWILPGLGLRVGALGYRNVPNGTETGWFSGRNAFWFGHADFDVMWSMFNSFHYNEHRFWDIVPYLRASAIYTSQGEGWHLEPGVGAGIHNGLRLGKRVDLYVEASAVAARETAYRERGGVIVFPSVTAGLVVRLGRQGFRRNEPIYVKGDTEYVDKEVIRIVRDTIPAPADSSLLQKMREEPLTLFFDINVTVLNQREMDHLEFYAKYALTPDSVVLLTGSADKETGSPEHNQWLSEQRNAFVRNLLVRVYGLKPWNIEEVANGDRKNEHRTPEQNRCVTISFIK